MRNRYRMFRRNGVYYVHDNLTGKQESLRRRDRAQAEKLCQARNESAQAPMLNRDLGRVYLSAGDPDSVKRTWLVVMQEIRSLGRASTQERYDRAMRDPALDGIRNKPIIETTAADLLTCSDMRLLEQLFVMDSSSSLRLRCGTSPFFYRIWVFHV